MKPEQLEELLLQSLEHEKGGVQVYQTAVKCAVNKELRKEWKNTWSRPPITYASRPISAPPWASTQRRRRQVVRSLGSALVAAMEQALAAGDPDAAQIVAAECVVLAETKDHLDWTLIGQCARKADDAQAGPLKLAYEEVEDEEDEHLYHSKGWCRELWVEALGMTAVLPPPEEKRHVKTAIGAARAEQSVATQR
jgi:hypothetical protein